MAGRSARRARSAAVSAAFLAAATLVTTRAWADEAADTAAARVLGGDGVNLADAGDCPQAIEKLRRAEELHHAPTTAGRLGECEINVGHLVAGTERLQRLLREPLAPSAPPPFVEAAARARRVLERALPRIATMRVTVRVPAGTKAHLIVDGERMADALLDADLPADPGHHTLLATAKGFFAKSQEITLTEGEKSAVTIELTPDPSARAAALHEIEAARRPQNGDLSSSVTSDDAKRGIGAAPIAAFAVGGVGLATGIITGLIVAHDSGDLSKSCTASHVCPADKGSELNSAKTWATISTVGFGVAGAGLGAAMLFLLLGNHHDAAGAAEAKVRPVVGPFYLGCEGAL